MPFPDGSGLDDSLWQDSLARTAAEQAAAGRAPAPAQHHAPAGSAQVPGFPPVHALAPEGPAVGGMFPAGLRPVNDPRYQTQPGAGLPAHLTRPATDFFPSPEQQNPDEALAASAEVAQLFGHTYQAPVALTASAATVGTPVSPTAWITDPATGALNLSGPVAAAPAPTAETVHSAVIFEPGGLHLGDKLPTDEDGKQLFWKVACKSGTLALSPGPGQMDMEKPLVLTPEMFTSIKTAFDEKAFPHVTVPETHENNVLQNTGYVRELIVLDSTDPRLPDEIKAAHASDPAGTKLLMTGVEFTQPDVRERAKNKSIPDTSIGVKFGYRNKRTGKTYAAALEHLSLTPVPWVDGLSAFHQGSYLSQRPFDQDELTVSFDGVYVPATDEGVDLAMRVRMNGDAYDNEKAKAAITALASGDEWSWDYGVCVRAMSLAGTDSTVYTLDGGYGLGDDASRTAVYTSLESLMPAVSGAVQRQEAKRAAAKAARAVGATVDSDYYSAPAGAAPAPPTEVTRDPLPEAAEVGELPGELHASIETKDTDQMTPPQSPTVEQILAQQQAEIERLGRELQASQSQVTLSQGTNNSLVEQVHTANVSERVKALQAGGVAPALCLAAKEIFLSDKSGLTNGGDGGLNLSVTKTVEKDGQVTTEQGTLRSPTEIVEYLLSAAPTVATDFASRMAAVHEGAAELSLASPHGKDGEQDKVASVDAHEREKHPERFKDNGKGERITA